MEQSQHVLALALKAENFRFEEAELQLPLGVLAGEFLSLFFGQLLGACQIAAQDIGADFAEDCGGIRAGSARRTIAAARQCSAQGERAEDYGG